MRPPPLRLRLRHALARQVETPLVRTLARWGVSPTHLTLAGLALAGLAGALAGLGHFRWAGLAFGLGSLMDLLDGALARAQGRASRWGALLDSTADRLGEGLALLGLGMAYAREGSPLGVALAFSASLAGFLVSYLRARSEGLGVPGADVGWLARPERTFLLTMGLLSGWPLWALGAVSALGLLTVAQRLRHARRHLTD